MGVVSLRSTFFVSVLLHTFVVVLWFLVLGHRTHEPLRQKFTVVELLPEKSRKLTKNDTKRIVQTDPGAKTETPSPESFLGERNQRVDKQTVSVQKKIAMGQAPAAAKSKVQEMTREILNKESIINHLGVTMVPQKIARTPAERAAQELFGLAGPQQTEVPHDYIKGLKESERTALNTKEYMFYGYFQRIRQRLDLAWSGHLREKLVKFYRGGRQLASDMDHITRTLVTLNVLGEIVRVQVIEESGVRDLDEAAINAFNQAGPFPNPPKGIVDRNGYIQIRWDFVLKT